MKKMRKLLPAFAMLLVSAVMMSTASFAWFSMSTTATATGMQVKATASSSLVITNAKTTAAFATADQDYDFQLGTIPSLIPVTHNGTDDGKLYVPKSTDAIDPVTGALMTGNTLEELTANNNNYYDFVVYVAAAGTSSITTTSLNAVVTTDAAALEHIHNAITIDFWVATVTNGVTAAGTYMGRTNLLTAAKATEGSTVSMNVTSIPQLYAEGESQANASVDCLEITMRVYFDGALLDDTTADTTDTYIRNLTAVLDAAGFTVTFKAVTNS